MILMYIRVPSAATVWQLEPIELIEGFLVSNHSKASVAMTGEYSRYILPSQWANPFWRT